MAVDPRLQGILRWSLAQSDGTAPARQISEEDRQWFKEAVESQIVDVVKRMKEISTVMRAGEEALLGQGVTVPEIEGMLEELQEHVESIDMANDLKAVGGLDPLLAFLRSPHAQLRARAAEVVMTMVQNNEKSQQNVMQAGGLVLLCDVFMHDSDVKARAKALGAISSLIRHNPEGLSTFRTICGVQKLLEGANSGDIKLARKSLHLMKYLVEQSPADAEACMAKPRPGQLAAFLASPESEIRTGAAEVLISAAARGGPTDAAVRSSLVQSVESRLRAIAGLEGEAVEDAADEKLALERLVGVLQGSVRMPDAEVEGKPVLLLGPPGR